MGRIDSSALAGVTAVFAGVETSGPAVDLVPRCYPNPFGTATNIAFSLPAAGYVQLYVYNVLGQRVAAFRDDRRRGPGRHLIELDRGDLAAGTYLYHLHFQNLGGERFRQSGKLTLAR